LFYFLKLDSKIAVCSGDYLVGGEGYLLDASFFGYFDIVFYFAVSCV